MTYRPSEPRKPILSGNAGSPAVTFSTKDFPGFSTKDLKALELYYSRQLTRHRKPEKRVGWQNAQSQRVRFEAFLLVGPLAGAKILDVGCGLGAFYGYLREKRIRADYTGVDLFPGLIEEAGRVYPKAHFEVRNVFSRPFPAGSFDYAFLSGVFNMKVRDNWKYMKALLTLVLGQTRKAVAFNALNVEAGIRERNRFTVSPGDLVAFGRGLGVSRVHLMDHYHRLDLTLFLYKR